MNHEHKSHEEIIPKITTEYFDPNKNSFADISEHIMRLEEVCFGNTGEDEYFSKEHLKNMIENPKSIMVLLKQGEILLVLR